MSRIQKRTRITRPIGSSSNSEVVEARSSATYGDFASLDARLENFEIIVAGASHGAVTLGADLEPILSINASQVLSLDSQSANLALLSPNGSAGDPTFRAIVAADLPASIVYNTRQVIAGAGMTGGGALSANVTLNVIAGDTSITVAADSIAVALATISGLQISSGLMIDDSIAGNGLAISSKVLAVGAGDGIDVSANSIAVDVTDLLGTGIIEEATNNLAVDFSVVAALSDLHSPVTISTALNSNLLSLTGQQLGLDNQSANLVFAGPATGASAAPSFRSLVFADIPSSENPGAAQSILASSADGYLQLVRIGLGVSPSYPLHAVSAANSEAFYVAANSITTGVAFTVEAPISTNTNTGKAFQVKVNGEAFGRVVFYTDGKFGVGDGTALRDTFLSRASAGTWLVSSDGGSGVGNIALNAGGTVDGVDISVHAASANAHHNQSHVLASTSGLGGDHTVAGLTSGQVLRATGATTAAFQSLVAGDLPAHVLATNSGLGSQHTISGATAGHVLRASSATAAAFAQLQHSDLGGVSANQHHNQSHVLATASGLGADHTVSGLTSGHVLVATGATTARFEALTTSIFPAYSAVRVYRSSGQTIGTGSNTAVSFTTESYDVGNLWVSGSPTRITINETGTWVFTAHVGWSGGNGQRYMRIRANGSTTLASSNTNGINDPQSVSTVMRLTAGEYVELMVEHNNASSIDTLTGLNGCSFSATRIG